MHDKTNCPHCGRLNDTYSTREPDDKPSEGDISLCWKCGGIAIFTEDDVRAPTPEEETEFSRDPEVKKFRYAIHEAITPSEAIRMVNESG